MIVKDSPGEFCGVWRTVKESAYRFTWTESLKNGLKKSNRTQKSTQKSNEGQKSTQKSKFPQKSTQKSNVLKKELKKGKLNGHFTQQITQKNSEQNEITQKSPIKSLFTHKRTQKINVAQKSEYNQKRIIFFFKFKNKISRLRVEAV